MRRRLYFVGRGGSSWRDPRNWSYEEGGRPFRHLHVRGNSHVIVCGVDGHEYLDLRGMPHGVLEIGGYRGTIRLPDGARLSFVPRRGARLRARIRREVVPFVPPSFVAAVDAAGGWRRAVLDRLATLGLTRRGLVLMPLAAGGAGFVQETLHGSNNGVTGGGTSQTTTVVNAPAAGNSLILSFVGTSENVTPSSAQLLSVTDSKGNTWVIDRSVNSNTAPCVAVVRTTQNVGALTTSDTITVNVSQVGSGGDPFIFAVHEVNGLVTATSPVDVTATANNTANTTSRNAGTTLATATAIEFVWAAFGANGTETSFTPGAGYTSPTTKFYAANSVSVEFEYKTTSATGTQNPTATGGISSHQRGVCVCYKMVTPVSPTIAGTSSLSATVTPYQSASASFAGSSALSATITPYQRFAAAIAGVASLAVTLTPYQRTSATISGTSSLSATLTPFERFVAALAGTSALSASVALYQRIAASVAGSSALTAVVTPFQRLVAAIAGSSALSFVLTPYLRFTANIDGTSSLDAEVTPYQELLAMLAGTSSLDAEVVPYQRIEASISGRSSLDLALTPYVRVSPTIAGTSSLVLVVTPYQRVAASLAGRSSLEAEVVPYRLMLASIAGSSSLDLSLVAERSILSLTPTFAGRSSLSATFAEYLRFLATISGTSSLSAALRIRRAAPILTPPLDVVLVSRITWVELLPREQADAVIASRRTWVEMGAR